MIGVTSDITAVNVPAHGTPHLTFADGTTGQVHVLDRMRGPVFERGRAPQGFAEVIRWKETTMSDPLITAVRFEDAHGRRLVPPMFDDGREDRLFGFFADEILFSEGDLGKTEAQACSLHFARDRDYLQT